MSVYYIYYFQWFNQHVNPLILTTVHVCTTYVCPCKFVLCVLGCVNLQIFNYSVLLIIVLGVRYNVMTFSPPFLQIIIKCEAIMCTGISLEQWRAAVGVMAARAKMRLSKKPTHSATRGVTTHRMRTQTNSTQCKTSQMRSLTFLDFPTGTCPTVADAVWGCRTKPWTYPTHHK